ncbi:hypothetical protein AB0D04_14865 [Streptomyces sp. NPDC048483]|uniref:hypothetical protein n=1 Tax=Streptomyces sp. NPDC048483 TaxID=3154927 RepID=UPI00344A6189
MDQGLAAVLGAVVGALATGSAAALASVSAERVQKKQARREAYRAFLEEMRSLPPYFGRLSTWMAQNVSRSANPIDEANEKFAEIDRRIESLGRFAVAVELEGPFKLSSQVAELFDLFERETGYLRRMYAYHRGDRASEHLAVVRIEIENELTECIRQIRYLTESNV